MRILLIGNCHAQYIGAAMSTMPSADVRVIGRPFPGPIHYKLILPPFVTAAEGMAFVADKGIILQQVTGSATALSVRLPDRPLIRFPYLEVRERFGMEPVYSAEDAFLAAGLSASLPGVLAALDLPAQTYGYNKYSGAVFAKILDALQPALAEYLPADEFSDMVEAVRADVGLGQGPDPSFPKLGAPGEQGAHAAWAPLVAEFVRTGRRRAFLECLTIYRPRRYARWAMDLTDALIKQRRVGLAAQLVCSRIAWEDARGGIFAHALRHCWAFRQDMKAYRTLQHAAQAAPDTTLPLLFECVRRMG